MTHSKLAKSISLLAVIAVATQATSQAAHPAHAKAAKAATHARSARNVHHANPKAKPASSTSLVPGYDEYGYRLDVDPKIPKPSGKFVQETNGLKTWVLHAGRGRTPAAGEMVHFHYKLWRTIGKLLDDSAGGNPLAVQAGTREPVPGINKVLMHMHVGEKRLIRIPAAEGFGSAKVNLPQGIVAPNSDLVAIVELVSIDLKPN